MCKHRTLRPLGKHRMFFAWREVMFCVCTCANIEHYFPPSKEYSVCPIAFAKRAREIQIEKTDRPLGTDRQNFLLTYFHAESGKFKMTAFDHIFAHYANSNVPK